MKHVQLSKPRLRFLFLSAKIWRHSGRVGVRYRDHYEEKGIFQRLMEPLRTIKKDDNGFVLVVPHGLGCSLTILHDYLCPLDEATLSSNNIGRQQTQTIELETKKDCGNGSSLHRLKGDLCA